MNQRAATITFCGCSTGCSATVIDADGKLTLPSAQLADNFVFDWDGGVDYVELFVRAHVVGQTLRDARGRLFVVRPEGA
jgi:hypothetical protein